MKCILGKRFQIQLNESLGNNKIAIYSIIRIKYEFEWNTVVKKLEIRESCFDCMYLPNIHYDLHTLRRMSNRLIANLGRQGNTHIELHSPTISLCYTFHQPINKSGIVTNIVTALVVQHMILTARGQKITY